MQSFYPETFERDMACTEAEWLAWLPRAMGSHPYQVTGQQAQVRLDEGQLQLAWHVEPPRVIALMRLPRLGLRFEFMGVPDGERHVFMARFDLYTQRGGG